MNLKIKKILFPTDLSSHSKYAFQYAADIAGRYDASVIVLHVLEELPVAVEAQLEGFLGGDDWQNIKDKHVAEAKEILIGKMSDKAKIRLALQSFWQNAKNDASRDDDIEDEIIIKEGSLVDIIVEQAEKSQCDLIVMAYYARSMIAEAMMGGVTRRVLRRSKKPVLLVPKEEN